MGNSHSSTTTANIPAPQKRRFLRRSRSPIPNHKNLGCPSGNESSEKSTLFREAVTEKTLFIETSGDEKRKLATLTTQLHVKYAPTDQIPLEGATGDYNEFLRDYPCYKLTWILDTLRQTDFKRLERTGETYVDYMGGTLYPERLIRVHTEFLNESVLGNTHSVSNSSRLSAKCADEARQAVLSFFKAPPEYTVVFTANASAALKLVGESYPFAGGGSLVLCVDSHNSVHGIREFASNREARVCYIPSTPNGGFETLAAESMLWDHRPRSKELTPSLFALTAQSNVTNSKNPLSIINYAASLGYHTLLDAAALAPSSTFSLADCPVDAMAISFYKMFGFPTGVGALVVRKDFLAQLKRPWFAGGTVNIVQVPGSIVTRAHELHEQFEDGTINYLGLPAVTDGLRFLSAYLPFLPLRLSSLLSYLVTSLTSLRHDTTRSPVVRVLSRVPTRRVKTIGEDAETGSLVSLIFLFPTGEMMPNSFIEYAASKQNISLRTGCMCNPGGAIAILGSKHYMTKLYPGATFRDFETMAGHELGVVRISLGLASNFQDVWKVVQFAIMMGKEGSRRIVWDKWIHETERMGMQIPGIGRV